MKKIILPMLLIMFLFASISATAEAHKYHAISRHHRHSVHHRHKSHANLSDKESPIKKESISISSIPIVPEEESIYTEKEVEEWEKYPIEEETPLEDKEASEAEFNEN